MYLSVSESGQNHAKYDGSDLLDLLYYHAKVMI